MQANDVRTKRLINEQKKNKKAKDQSTLPKGIISFGPLDTDQGPDLNKWILKFEGQPPDGNTFVTDLSPGKYICNFEIVPEYPHKPPKLSFPKPIPQHMHVYGDGGVCLGKVNAAKYSASTSLTEIAISLFKMMHEKPTEGDPANVGLSEVFKKNQKQYYDLIKQEAMQIHCKTNLG